LVERKLPKLEVAGSTPVVRFFWLARAKNQPNREVVLTPFRTWLPGLHTQGENMDDAMANANEAVALYVEGLREDGESLTWALSVAGSLPMLASYLLQPRHICERAEQTDYIPDP
jgi:hypothetical protein